MGLVPIFLQAFGVGFSGAVMPGPLLTYNIQLSYKKGFWAGPQIIIGHAVLEALLVIGLMLGLGKIIQLPAVKITLFIIGGLLLAWMGWGLIAAERRSTGQGLVLTEKETAAAGVGEVKSRSRLDATGLHPVIAGALISVSNPYWLLWWSTLGLVLITQAVGAGAIGVVAFYTGHILSDLLWYSFISLAIAKGRNLIPDTFYRGLLLICGLFLLVFAGMFLYNALLMLGIIPDLFGRAVDLFKPLSKLI